MRIRRRIDVAVEPGVEEELTSGKLFTFTCPSCGRAARIVHPELSYRDAKRGLSIQMDALGKLDPAALGEAAGVTRIVRDSNALLEKVKLFAAGLDDRVIEVLKIVVGSQSGDDTPTRYLFEGTGTPSSPDGRDLRFTLLSAKGISGLAVPRAAYDDLRAKLDAAGKLAPAPAWAVVDADYARLVLAT